MARHIFVGAGIASLAGAALLIRDHGVAGPDIEILEAGPVDGGSLDGGQLQDGAFVVRGARIMEEHYRCTYDLMASIPSPDLPGDSLAADLDVFNAENPTSYACIPVLPGGTTLEPHYALPRRHLRTFLTMLLRRESRLDGKRICDVFDKDFFGSDMWLTVSTVFAFQPWHSAAELRRYMRRFLHSAQGGTLGKTIRTTRFNQYDSLIAPLRAWLTERGVTLTLGTTVEDARFDALPGAGRRVTALVVDGAERPVAPEDRVYFTLGSMTDGARVWMAGEPPPTAAPTPSFDLWTRLAAAAPGFGRPEVFAPDTALTGWHSFTLTLPEGGLCAYLHGFRPEDGGAATLYALDRSPWRAALVPFTQPHFRDQPEGTEVIWGYGLRPDRPGAHCGVPMETASADDVIDEIAGHFAMDAETRARLFRNASVVSCRMPLITSQFMPRRPGDRPAIHPDGAMNYACMGQFVEIPHDTVFTVEYSVRSAWEAVNRLNPDGGRPVPPVARPDRDLRVIKNVAFHRLRNIG